MSQVAYGLRGGGGIQVTHVPDCAPPPVNRVTHTSENITFTRTKNEFLSAQLATCSICKRLILSFKRVLTKLVFQFLVVN